MEENKNNIRSLLLAIKVEVDENLIDLLDYFFDVKVKDTDGGHIDLNTKAVDSVTEHR